MRRLALLLALAAGPAFAQARITEPQVRDFVARQERAWNAGDLAAYFAAYTPGATFTDQAYVGDKPPVSYGTSSLAEARAQAGRATARTKVREAGRIMRIEIAPNGRSAKVVLRVASTVETAGRTRRLCASRGQTLVLAADGRLRSAGQTDTFVRCSR